MKILNGDLTSILLASAIVLSLALAVPVIPPLSSNQALAQFGSNSLVPHDPIYIDGDNSFTPANGATSGSGTENDPYVIEGWDISAKNDHGIWINNTTAYFIIRNCYVHGGKENYLGIYFESVKNGRIDNVTSNTNIVGIEFGSSNKNSIENCTIENNQFEGIRVDYGVSNAVTNCVISNNQIGILFAGADNNVVAGCVLKNSSDCGVYFALSDNNVVKGCVIENNNDGIRLRRNSENNLIVNNIVLNNFSGILLDSDHNHVFHNHFKCNTVQAWSRTMTNRWDNGYPSGGNYWSDYAGADKYQGENQDIPGGDGIGDSPYPIPTFWEWPVYDYYPLVVREVDVQISPTYQDCLHGATVTYTVTVTNTGNLDDNYLLTVSDDADWALTLSANLLEDMIPGENRAVTLTVTIPENVAQCTEDNIIATATSAENAEVSDSDSCVAHAVSKAEFSLVTLYEVNLDAYIYLEEGSKLVLKFYTYGDAYQGENVAWSGTTPASVFLLENALHPFGEPVENAVLILTAENTDNVISTIASFTVHQSHLRDRDKDILIAWGGHPELHDAFRAEVKDILRQWSSAPP